MKITKIIFLAILLLVSSTLYAADKNTFISIADVHFTPFDICKVNQPCELIIKLKNSPVEKWQSLLEKYAVEYPSTYYLDTNYALLKISLAQIKKISREQNVKFGLLLGDLLAHDYQEQYKNFSNDNTKEGYEKFVNKTLKFLSEQFHETLPTTTIYPAVGNNDAYNGDYGIQANGNFFTNTAYTWEEFFNNANESQTFLDEFTTAGYYAVKIPDTNIKLIMLNTVLFSIYRHPNNAAIEEMAQQQLKWLHTQLRKAEKNNEKVWLAYHIPEGMNFHSILKNIFNNEQHFWFSRFRLSMQKELRQFPNLVMVILPAHIHTESFRIFSKDTVENIPILFTPSISPNYGNDPGFKIFEFDEAGDVKVKQVVTLSLSNRLHLKWITVK